MRIVLPTGHIVNLKVKVYKKGDIMIGLDSGDAFKGSHYVFMDYDTRYPHDFLDLMDEYKLKRGLVVESSPGNYHALSFSPQPYEKMIEIMRKSNCDPKHLSCTIRYGYSTLRVSEKRGSMPRIAQELTNMHGNQFYNFNAERVYRENLVNIKDVDKPVNSQSCSRGLLDGTRYEITKETKGDGK